MQPGFGRTGDNFWGFESEGLTPDIVTMGKPMGNGHPIAAMVASRALVESFSKSVGYFNTFGGNPVSCAAALAVLDVLEEEHLQANAAKQGRRMLKGLQKLAEQHEIIGDVRGNGLFVAVELISDRADRVPATELTARVVNGLRERGVLTGSIGPDNNIVKLRPPMVLGGDEVDLMLETLEATLAALSA